MDEEDLAERAEAQKLQTTSAFAGLGSLDEHPSQGGVFTDILRKDRDTMGVRLLQKMGWRPGQGIGPKVRRKARPDTLTDAADEGEDMHLFAPDNSKLIGFTAKNDHKGLGFEGEAALSASINSKDNQPETAHEPDPFLPSKPKKKGKPLNRGGFGVGILNDNGSDDEDPYAVGPRLSYNRVHPPDRKQKGQANGKPVAATANPLLSAKPIFKSRKGNNRIPSPGRRHCHDGRPPLDGFVLASKPYAVGETHNIAIPKPPPGWKSSKTHAKEEGIDSHSAPSQDRSRLSALDPKSRAALLGEAQLPGKSVFDFLSSAARDRIASASGRQDLPAALGEAPTPLPASLSSNETSRLKSALPPLDTDVAVAALRRGTTGWMPYSDDTDKQARYRAFLEYKAGVSDVLPKGASGMSQDDVIKELYEFAQAAQVFKPMTGLMASRFTTSRAPLEPSMGDAGQDTVAPTEPTIKQEDPAEAAAKIGMYGQMTRSTHAFLPTRLVCKRFNVSQPANVQPDNPEAKPGETNQPAASLDRLQIMPKAAMDKLMHQSSTMPGALKTVAHGATERVAESQTVETKVEVERNEALESERPGEDVFRAIFGSDDDDE